MVLDRPVTVTELNGYVSELLSADPFLHSLRVAGEISGCKRYPSGHLYFSLKDETALVRCVMFRQQAMRLSFQPADGMQVVLTGYVSLYAKDGAYQLYALSLEKQGEGELYRRFAALKSRLEAEGYFDEAHKKPIPFLPKRVGVVTSGAGAAVQDVLQIIGRRFPAMPVVLAPVKVQGAGAAEEIAAAIGEMNEKRAADVLIVGRGGGSIEDLWAFNEPVVAEAIYQSEIPVISAVGHETDFTIADFVADLRAPTPSAAAELAVPEWSACAENVQGLVRRLNRGLSGTVTHGRNRVALLLSRPGFRAPSERIAELRLTIDQTAAQMARCLLDRAKSERARLDTDAERLRTMSPLAVLGRGYALVRTEDGGTATGVSALAAGRRIKLLMRDGMADATVDRVEKRKE